MKTSITEQLFICYHMTHKKHIKSTKYQISITKSGRNWI